MLQISKIISQGAGLAPVLVKRASALELDWDTRQKSRFDSVDSQGRALGADAFEHVEVAGRAVLIRTGWSASFGTEQYAVDAPFLAADGVRALVERGAAMVGIDSVNIDDLTDLSRPAHTKLLGAGVPICEHMTNLSAIDGEGWMLHAVPIAWVGGATFPVRAYLVK